MTPESRWREEWEVLRAERRAARQRWRGAADGLSAWSRDPLGIARLVRGHPVAAGGILAGLAALLVKRLLGSGGAKEDEGPPPAGEPAPPPVPWKAMLRDAALGLAVPWILGRLKDGLGGERRRGAPGDEG